MEFFLIFLSIDIIEVNRGTQFHALNIFAVYLYNNIRNCSVQATFLKHFLIKVLAIIGSSKHFSFFSLQKNT